MMFEDKFAIALLARDLIEQLEALAEKATPGQLMMYGEPDVGLRTEPFFGTPLNGDMRPLADWRAYDADLVVALWNNLPAIITALRADQRCAELEDENARLLREAGRLEERSALHKMERRLFLHDTEINDIVQRRLGHGEWFIGAEGYVRSTAIERKALENRDG